GSVVLIQDAAVDSITQRIRNAGAYHAAVSEVVFLAQWRWWGRRHGCYWCGGSDRWRFRRSRDRRVGGRDGHSRYFAFQCKGERISVGVIGAEGNAARIGTLGCRVALHFKGGVAPRLYRQTVVKVLHQRKACTVQGERFGEGQIGIPGVANFKAAENRRACRADEGR